jgi:carbonic anhydrase
MKILLLRNPISLKVPEQMPKFEKKSLIAPSVLSRFLRKSRKLKKIISGLPFLEVDKQKRIVELEIQNIRQGFDNLRSSGIIIDTLSRMSLMEPGKKQTV